MEKTKEVLTSTSAKFRRLNVEVNFVGVESGPVEAAAAEVEEEEEEGEMPGKRLKLSPTETGWMDE